MQQSRSPFTSAQSPDSPDPRVSKVPGEHHVCTEDQSPVLDITEVSSHGTFRHQLNTSLQTNSPTPNPRRACSHPSPSCIHFLLTTTLHLAADATGIQGACSTTVQGLPPAHLLGDPQQTS